MANHGGGGVKQWWWNVLEAQAALIFEGRRCIYSATDLGFKNLTSLTASVDSKLRHKHA